MRRSTLGQGPGETAGWRPSGLHLRQGGWQPSDDTSEDTAQAGVSCQGFRFLPVQMIALHVAHGKEQATLPRVRGKQTHRAEASFRPMTTSMPPLALCEQEALGRGPRCEPGVGCLDSVGFFVSEFSMEHLSLSNSWVGERPSATEYVQSTELRVALSSLKHLSKLSLGLRFYYEQPGLIRARWVGGAAEKTVAGWLGGWVGRMLGRKAGVSSCFTHWFGPERVGRKRK